MAEYLDCEISLDTRTIKTGSSVYTVQLNDNVDGIRFLLPVGISEYITLENPVVTLLYLAPGTSQGRTLTLSLGENDGTFYFIFWTFETEFTQYSGVGTFSICIESFENAGDTSATGHWNSQPAKITVYPTMDHDNLVPSGDTEVTPAYIVAIENAVSAYMDDNPSQGGGLTDNVKTALLNAFAHVAWVDANGQTYYDALEDALYPPANLVSISAIYTQSGDVYDNQTLDSLRSDLVVTAHMSDSTTQTVTTYTLSGTLATGTSTITVAYGGKTATFTVTVTHAVTQYSITNNLTNCTNSNSATVINEETAYSGTLTATSGNVMSTVAITMGGTDVTSTVYNSETGAISIASVTGNVVITAEAVEDVGWISGVPYDMTDGLTENKYLNNGVETAYNGWDISPYMQCLGAFIISDTSFALNYCAGYDSEDSYVQRVKVVQGILTNYDALGCTSFRVSDTSSKVAGAVITPYRLPELSETTAYETSQYYAPSEWTEGGYVKASTGAIVTDNECKYSGYMNCYNASVLTDNLMQFRTYAFYDGDKNFISGVEIPESDATQNKQTSIPSGARYFIASTVTGRYNLCFKLD